MTAEELCGHRWPVSCLHPRHEHRCDLPADHHNAKPFPRPCACRCGATTTRRGER